MIHSLLADRPTDFVCQPRGSDTQLTSECLPYVMVQHSFVLGHRVGAASSVCYACHWRGMGRPKPTQAATWNPPRPEPGGHHGEHADAEPLRGLGEDE